MNATDITVIVQKKSYRLSINYDEFGPQCILCIHGIGCTKDSFNEIWSDKNRFDASVLSVDLPGFGDSEKSSRFSYTLEEHAEVLRALIEKLGIEKVHIVGHSMGGAIGLLLANQIPRKVETFVNVEGNLFPEDCWISRQVANQKTTKEKIIFDKATSDNPGVKLWAEMLVKASSDAFFRSAGSLVKWSDRNELMKIFCSLPVRKVYIYGKDSESDIIPAFESDGKKYGECKKAEIFNRIQNKGIECPSIPKSNHFPMVENPGQFYGKLREVLTRP